MITKKDKCILTEIFLQILGILLLFVGNTYRWLFSDLNLDFIETTKFSYDSLIRIQISPIIEILQISLMVITIVSLIFKLENIKSKTIYILSKTAPYISLFLYIIVSIIIITFPGTTFIPKLKDSGILIFISLETMFYIEMLLLIAISVINYLVFNKE